MHINQYTIVAYGDERNSALLAEHFTDGDANTRVDAVCRPAPALRP